MLKNSPAESGASGTETASKSPAANLPKDPDVKATLPQYDPEEYELRKRLPSKFPTRKNDVYVTRRTNFKAQAERCRKLLDQGFDEIWIHGLGPAINRGINLALQLKRQMLGTVDVDVKTATLEVTDELWPLVDDLDVQMRIRNLSAVHIRVFRPTVAVEDY